MADQTGRARGSLQPVIYFENFKDPGFPVGWIILAPAENGTNPREFARQAFEGIEGKMGRGYRDRGWAWRETGSSLTDVDELQKALIAQERLRHAKAAERDDEYTEMLFRQTGDELKRRMVSSSTTPWERDAIGYYLKMRDEKRAVHRHSIEHYGEYFIAAREMDSSSKVEDLL